METKGLSRLEQLVEPVAEVAVRPGKWWTRCGAVVRPAGIVDLDPHDTRRSEASALTGPPERPTVRHRQEADGRRMVMLQQYDDAVEVRAAEGTPEHFLWRGRLWKVCTVLSHWIETAAWWRTDPADIGWGPERRVYRVEAASGRHARSETFELAFDPTSDRWQVERVTER